MSFVPHGETFNAQYYAPYLQNHLCSAVRHKRPQLQCDPHKATPQSDLCQGFATTMEVGSTGAYTILIGPFAL